MHFYRHSILHTNIIACRIPTCTCLSFVAGVFVFANPSYYSYIKLYPLSTCVSSICAYLDSQLLFLFEINTYKFGIFTRFYGLENRVKVQPSVPNLFSKLSNLRHPPWCCLRGKDPLAARMVHADGVSLSKPSPRGSKELRSMKKHIRNGVLYPAVSFFDHPFWQSLVTNEVW